MRAVVLDLVQPFAARGQPGQEGTLQHALARRLVASARAYVGFVRNACRASDDTPRRCRIPPRFQ
jgi:hypothetical protein